MNSSQKRVYPTEGERGLEIFFTIFYGLNRKECLPLFF